MPPKPLADIVVTRDRKVDLSTLCSKVNPSPPAEMVAAALNISVTYARHVFKQQVGLSCSAYVKIVRLENARQLLLAGQLRVKEIMARVGYNDFSHFVRDYKRQHGERPSQTRLALDRTMNSRFGQENAVS